MDLGSTALNRFWHGSKELPGLKDGFLAGEFLRSYQAEPAGYEPVGVEAALRDSEAVNRSIVEASSDCVLILDLEGRLIFMNGPGANALEIEDASFLYGKFWAELWPGRAQRFATMAVADAQEGRAGRFSGSSPTAKGNLKWWDVVVSPVVGADGHPIKLVALATDVTERTIADEKLRQAATCDSLTGLLNRTSFQEKLAEAVRRAEAGKTNLGLLLIDLDDFKNVNDALGHDAGDALLKTFAKRLKHCSKSAIVVARLGGDEFAVLLDRVTTAEELTERAAAMLGEMREPFVHSGRILDCYATMGAALYPDHGITPDKLLKSADIALYEAKASSRGGVVPFQPAHESKMQQRLNMVRLGRSAVREDRIQAYYQPKVLISDRSIDGFEALLRWHHPHKGVQLPSSITAAFEDLELATAISDKIVNQVIRDMSEWLDSGVSFGHVAVNSGAAEFRRDNFAESLLDRLEKSGVPPKLFQLEVTETVFLGRGSEYVDRALKLLAGAGVTIALDDFGTGYASLRHLKQFPVHVIKIDQSFVRNMISDPDDASITAAVINLGHSLGIKVIAEGIETEVQERRLHDLGCRFGQGFLYSKAIAPGCVAGLLAASAAETRTALA